MLGAAHDAQVAYSLGNLDSQRRYAWTAADYDVSRIFSRYLEQFVKTGNPNGLPAIGEGVSVDHAARSHVAAVPDWPAVRVESQGTLLQSIGENTRSTWDNSASNQDLAQQQAENGGAATR
jgi:para-nitrobenzyl esterase